MKNKNNLDPPSAANETDGGSVCGDIQNLSTIAKLTKFKMLKAKKSNFTKTNSFKTDFLSSGAKEPLIHLRKAFTEALILEYFNLKCHICIITNALGYTIGKTFCQIT